MVLALSHIIHHTRLITVWVMFVSLYAATIAAVVALALVGDCMSGR
jgi:hypothetical protein